MTLLELSDILNVDIVIRRYANQNGRYMARFDKAEVKENEGSVGLLGEFGNGKTAIGAMNNYASRISGKWLVIGALSDNRREFGVPASMENV